MAVAELGFTMPTAKINSAENNLHGSDYREVSLIQPTTPSVTSRLPKHVAESLSIQAFP